MGLLSWLFPSPADRIAKAKGYLATERWADARLEVLDLEETEPEALEIVLAAERQLALVNLAAAVSWAHAGDDYRVQNHLELADEYQQKGMEEEFREARKEIRELRATRDAEDKAHREAEEARLLQVDPFGLSGGPSLLRPPLPDDLASEDAVELAARLDLLVANYPDDLRETIGDLGPDFAQAVLDLDDGRADIALQTLLALPEDHPVVCWETARAAYSLGDAAATARSLRKFANLVGGHRTIGNNHTGVFLAQTTAESGDLAGAIRVLRDLGPPSLKMGGFLLAQLLFTTGELEEAETLCRGMLKEAGKYLALYALLAQIRLAGGHRVEAMTALEAAMDQTCGTAGACGYMPPDPGIVRLLSTLYLEDGIETERALTLWDQLQGMQREPSMDERYLAALVARSQGDPEADELTQSLWTQAQDKSPLRERLQKYLPLSA